MHIVSTEELSVRQILIYSKDRIVFNNKLLNRGPSFSKKLKQAAINFCHQFEQSKLFHLIVESNSHVTVWIEDDKIKNKGFIGSENQQTKTSPRNKEKVPNFLPAENCLRNYSSSAEKIRVEATAREALQKGSSTDLVIQELLQDPYLQEIEAKIGSKKTLELVSNLVKDLFTEMLLKKLKSSYGFIKN